MSRMDGKKTNTHKQQALESRFGRIFFMVGFLELMMIIRRYFRVVSGQPMLVELVILRDRQIPASRGRRRALPKKKLGQIFLVDVHSWRGCFDPKTGVRANLVGSTK